MADNILQSGAELVMYVTNISAKYAIRPTRYLIQQMVNELLQNTVIKVTRVAIPVDKNSEFERIDAQTYFGFITLNTNNYDI